MVFILAGILALIMSYFINKRYVFHSMDLWVKRFVGYYLVSLIIVSFAIIIIIPVILIALAIMAIILVYDMVSNKTTKGKIISLIAIVVLGLFIYSKTYVNNKEETNNSIAQQKEIYNKNKSESSIKNYNDSAQNNNQELPKSYNDSTQEDIKSTDSESLVLDDTLYGDWKSSNGIRTTIDENYIFDSPYVVQRKVDNTYIVKILDSSGDYTISIKPNDQGIVISNYNESNDTYNNAELYYNLGI